MSRVLAVPAFLVSIGPVGVQTAGPVGIIAAWLAVRVAEKEMVAKGHAPEVVRATGRVSSCCWWTCEIVRRAP